MLYDLGAALFLDQDPQNVPVRQRRDGNQLREELEENVDRAIFILVGSTCVIFLRIRKTLKLKILRSVLKQKELDFEAWLNSKV